MVSMTLKQNYSKHRNSKAISMNFRPELHKMHKNS